MNQYIKSQISFAEIFSLHTSLSNASSSSGPISLISLTQNITTQLTLPRKKTQHTTQTLINKMESSGASEMTNLPSSMHFVIVHGACYGGWCWYKVRSLLESIGQTVSCPDLAGCGIDRSNADTISTFQEYNKPLHDILSSLSSSQKVILVGHSAGGLSLIDAIHNFPDKIQVAVFVVATMLRNGIETEQDRIQGVPDLSEYGDVVNYNYGQGRDNPPTSALIKKEAHREILCQMSPLEDYTLSAMLVRPYPLKALNEAVFLEKNKDDIDKVPRVYIKTMHDNVFSLEHQDSMIKRWPPCDVYTIDGDHSPMLSHPSQLFGLLVKIAAKFGS